MREGAGERHEREKKGGREEKDREKEIERGV